MDLPTFPCWCRATYSWGGETKKDLGFIEGDLIEALNAGDGSWWMGRLRRDPRAIGLFPSNFVQVLEPTFTPVRRGSGLVSPAPTPSKTSTPVNGGANTPTRNEGGQGSVFRKPFQAYGSVNGKKGESREGTPDSDREKEKARKSKFRPYSSMKTAQAPMGSFRNGIDLAAAAAAAGAERENGEPAFRVPIPPPRGAARSRNVSLTSTLPPAGGIRAVDPVARVRATSPRPGYSPSRNGSLDRGSQASEAVSRPRTPLPTTFHDGSAYPQLMSSPSRPTSRGQEQEDFAQGAGEQVYEHEQYGYEDGTGQQPMFEDDDRGYDLGSSPPPPPPPAHRVVYQPSQHAPPPQQQRGSGYDYDHHNHMSHHYDLEDRISDDYDRQNHMPNEYDRHATPSRPTTPGGAGMTPSPLRDAMNDVMTSLQDMSVSQYDDPSSPPHVEMPRGADIWSPEAYDLVRKQSQNQARSQSAFGYTSQNRSFHYEDDEEARVPSLPSSSLVPEFDSSHAHRLHHQHSYSVDLPPAPPLKDQHYANRPNTAGSATSSQSGPKHPTPLYHAHQQRVHQQNNLHHRKSAYELSTREPLQRTYTTKTNVTNSTETSSATHSSASTALTNHSIMSGHSAGGFSATSAGSLARRKFGMGSQRSRRALSVVDTRSTPDIAAAVAAARELTRGEASDSASGSGSGPSYHDSHSSRHLPAPTPTADWLRDPLEQSAGILGGLSAPSAVLGGLASPSTSRSKKSGFLRKMIDSAKTTARTGAANARSTISSRPGSRSGPPSPSKSISGGGFGGGLSSMNAHPVSSGIAQDMGFGSGPTSGAEWMQVRRDVNRSNSLSRREKEERAERCELLDLPVLYPVDQFNEMVEGDESMDGFPVTDPTNFHVSSLALVDKSVRFLQNVPPMISPGALAQSYLCRQHRSDVQRLRAIFTWVSERVTWEDDFEGQVDIRRIVQTKRGSSEEIAALVYEMCHAVGLHAETVQGYLKSPGEIVDVDALARPNHWWNTVIVDGEWRMMDCSLAGPTHPRRGAYSSVGSQIADSWYFLARPLEICYTHVPLLAEHQHIVPPVPVDLLVALPCACPAYFRNGIELVDFSTTMLHLENLEMSHLHIHVPEDVECVAEVQARTFARDADGDVFESGDTIAPKPALSQPEWTAAGRKRFTIKALLPGDEGRAILKIYAGKRGLRHSIKDNPHPLALVLPLSHLGPNPPYDFLTRHPTPHAQRHDLYIAQPQCARLGVNNTFVFSVRQHPSSLSRFTPDSWGATLASSTSRPGSPLPPARPSSAMSMVSASASSSVAGSSFSGSASASGAAPHPGGDDGRAGEGPTMAQLKPAKLAIQSPSQRITRLTRKAEPASSNSSNGGGGGGGGGNEDRAAAQTTTWETVIKVSERGTWRALVLADRSARWCVFAEWECV